MSDLVGLLGLSEAYELNWCHSTLVQQLEETMLPVGAWLPEVDHSSWVGDDLSLPVDPLSVSRLPSVMAPVKWHSVLLAQP